MAIDVTISGLNTVVDVAPLTSEVIDISTGQTVIIDEGGSSARDTSVSGLNTEVDVTMNSTAPIDADTGQVIVIEDYESLANRPKINGTTLIGDKTSAEIGVADADHTHNAFTGTDGVTAGTSGFVPAPTASDSGKVLGADGTWVTGGGGGTITDVTVNGTSVVNNGVAAIQSTLVQIVRW